MVKEDRHIAALKISYNILVTFSDSLKFSFRGYLFTRRQHRNGTQ